MAHTLGLSIQIFKISIFLVTELSVLGHTGTDSGWIVTSRGYLFEYVPTSSESSGLLSLWIVIAIPAATGLVVLCLVYLASPKKMQDWTIERIGNEDERKDLARRRAKQQRKRR